MKKNNPVTPILLRDAQGTLPKVYARFGRFPSVLWGVLYPDGLLTIVGLAEFGKEKSQSLEGRLPLWRVFGGRTMLTWTMYRPFG